MNWISALKTFYGLFPADPSASFRWLPVEKQIQKTLGLDRVVFALREGKDLLRENGAQAFEEADRSRLLSRFGEKPKPWILSAREGGAWIGFWPIGRGPHWDACWGLGRKKKGNRLGPDEERFLDLAADRAALYFQTSRLWQSLEMADRRSAVGLLSLAAAHEIRNPLTAMGTLVQLLPRKKMDGVFVDDFQRVMEREIGHLTHLTESLLDFAKPGGRKIESVNLQGVVAQVAKLLKPLLDLKKTKFVIRNTGKLFLNGDIHQIQSLLMNLLQNAFQAAGPGGAVHISSGGWRAPNGKKWIQLNVTDNGPGIPRENLDKIFDPYFSTKTGGVGLGLVICGKIVEDHGGSIRVQSSSGRGTRFTVRLPGAIKA